MIYAVMADFEKKEMFVRAFSESSFCEKYRTYNACALGYGLDEKENPKPINVFYENEREAIKTAKRRSLKCQFSYNEGRNILQTGD